MFKSIKAALSQKQENLNTQSSTSVLVRKAVQAYIRENYPETLLHIGVQYRVDDRVVVISTPSKTLAGELALNAGEIRSYLTSHNIRVDRILTR